MAPGSFVKGMKNLLKSNNKAERRKSAQPEESRQPATDTQSQQSRRTAHSRADNNELPDKEGFAVLKSRQKQHNLVSATSDYGGSERERRDSGTSSIFREQHSSLSRCQQTPLPQQRRSDSISEHGDVLSTRPLIDGRAKEAATRQSLARQEREMEKQRQRSSQQSKRTHSSERDCQDERGYSAPPNVSSSSSRRKKDNRILQKHTAAELRRASHATIDSLEFPEQQHELGPPPVGDRASESGRRTAAAELRSEHLRSFEELVDPAEHPYYNDVQDSHSTRQHKERPGVSSRPFARDGTPPHDARHFSNGEPQAYAASEAGGDRRLRSEQSGPASGRAPPSLTSRTRRHELAMEEQLPAGRVSRSLHTIAVTSGFGRDYQTALENESWHSPSPHSLTGGMASEGRPRQSRSHLSELPEPTERRRMPSSRRSRLEREWADQQQASYSRHSSPPRQPPFIEPELLRSRSETLDRPEHFMPREQERTVSPVSTRSRNTTAAVRTSPGDRLRLQETPERAYPSRASGIRSRLDDWHPEALRHGGRLQAAYENGARELAYETGSQYTRTAESIRSGRASDYPGAVDRELEWDTQQLSSGFPQYSRDFESDGRAYRQGQQRGTQTFIDRPAAYSGLRTGGDPRGNYPVASLARSRFTGPAHSGRAPYGEARDTWRSERSTRSQGFARSRPDWEEYQTPAGLSRREMAAAEDRYACREYSGHPETMSQAGDFRRRGGGMEIPVPMAGLESRQFDTESLASYGEYSQYGRSFKDGPLRRMEAARSSRSPQGFYGNPNESREAASSRPHTPASEHRDQHKERQLGLDVSENLEVEKVYTPEAETEPARRLTYSPTSPHVEEAMQAAHKQIESLRSKLKTRQVESAGREIQTLQSVLTNEDESSQEEELLELRRVVAFLQNKTAGLENELHTTREQQSSASNERSAAKDELETLQKRLAAAEGGKSNLLTLVNELRGNLERAVGEKAAELKQAHSDLSLAQSEALHQEELAEMAKGELDEYKRRMAAEVEHARKEALKLVSIQTSGEAAALIEEARQARMAAARAKQEQDALRKGLDANAQERAELVESICRLQEEMEASRATITAMEATIEKLKHHKDQQEAARKQAEADAAELESVRETVTSLKADNTTLQSALEEAQARAEAHEQQQQLDSSRDASEIPKQYRELVDESVYDSLDLDLDLEGFDPSIQDEKLREAVRSIKELEAKIASANLSARNLSEEKAELIAEASELRAKLASCSEELQRLRDVEVLADEALKALEAQTQEAMRLRSHAAEVDSLLQQKEAQLKEALERQEVLEEAIADRDAKIFEQTGNAWPPKNMNDLRNAYVGAHILQPDNSNGDTPRGTAQLGNGSGPYQTAMAADRNPRIAREESAVKLAQAAYKRAAAADAENMRLRKLMAETSSVAGHG